jgi:Sulfotransferase domain
VSAQIKRFVRAVGEASRIVLGKKPAGRNLTTFPDDVFIVSYPRSGNTWTRFLIANVEERVPEIYLFPDRVLRQLQRPRILKSHECFDPRYKTIIYIVRDPRDVAVSYYHYAIKREWIGERYTIEEFVPRFITGEFDVRARWAASWDDHVMSWISMRQGRDGFLMLRYEDMVQDAEQALLKIAQLLKIDASAERVSRAVQLSSADHMRQLEKKEGSQWLLTKKTRQDKPFVRTAKSGDWQKALPESCVSRIEAAWGPIMQAAGYRLSSLPSIAVRD